MSEEVAAAEAVESPDAPVEEQPTTPAPESETTWKARLAGKDRALTEAKQKLADARREADELSRWKAEKEQAEMSEFDKLRAQLAQRESEVAAAKAEANRERLARKFPLATELLGDDPLPSEEKLQAIEERLTAAATPPAAAEPEPEPRVDPNNPRRTAPAPKEQSIDELRARIGEFGRDFFA